MLLRVFGNYQLKFSFIGSYLNSATALYKDYLIIALNVRYVFRTENNRNMKK